MDVRAVVHRTQKFSLEIQTPRRVYVFRANEEEDQQGWIAAMRDTMQKLAMRRRQGSIDGFWSSVCVQNFEHVSFVISKPHCTTLVRERVTGDLFELTALPRGVDDDEDDDDDGGGGGGRELFLAEVKRIRYQVQNPYLRPLTWAFETQQYFYLVSRSLVDGTPFSLIAPQTPFAILNEESVRFYAAEMVIALHGLHSKGILHGNLTSDTVILAQDGHLYLAEFGISACRAPKLMTQYMAPEQLIGAQHRGKAADWWSFGAIIYELLTGRPPFYGPTSDELVRQRILLEDSIEIPPSLTPQAGSLLRALLERDETKRIQQAEVRAHPFFEDVCWADVARRCMKPPPSCENLNRSKVN